MNTAEEMSMHIHRDWELIEVLLGLNTPVRPHHSAVARDEALVRCGNIHCDETNETTLLAIQITDERGAPTFFCTAACLNQNTAAQ